MSDDPRQTEGLTEDGLPEAAPVVVEAIEGPSAGARFVLTGGTAVVGSASDCDLVLDDRAVSRRHLSVELLRGAVMLRDLKSRNGTRYLGATLTQARVPVGSTVELGRTVLRIAPAARPEAPVSERSELPGLVARSLAMRRLFALVEKAAASDSPVLLEGETGVGKGGVARALHELSARRAGPFVTFDCGAVSAQLIESELFGHARGAFTGADAARTGLVEAAAGGTLFLDEIGELALSLQPKLLRVLETGEFTRLGETRVRTANARIVAATNRKLDEAIAAGRFREDLYFRLAVVVLHVPSLRERREDIPLLAERFVREKTGVDLKLSPATLAALQCAPWPGNVRELRNAVQRMLALGSEDLGAPAGPAAAAPGLKEIRSELVGTFEGDYLRSLLERNGGNVSAAAREAGISRRQMYRLLERHGLK